MGSGAAGVQRIDGDDLRWPRRERRRGRRCRASGGPWIGGDEERVEAELASTARVEGETVAAALRWRGCGYARRVRESRGEEGVQREREGRSGGVSWLHQGVEGEAASRRWPGRVPARCGHAL